MDELIEKIDRCKRHPVEVAVLLHHGYPPVVLKKEDRGKYYRFLRAADAENPGLFVNFIAKAVNDNLTMYLSIFGGVNELIPLKELAENTSYSQEYLSLRARQGVLDAAKLGKRWYSTRHAIEQYLSEHGKR